MSTTGYLTRRQRQMLDFLGAFVEENGYSPTLEEIAEGMGLSSLATVHAHLRNLEAKRAIRRQHNRGRSIELLEPTRAGAARGAGRRAVVELPLLGRVAAGRPIEAVEIQESIEVPSEFLSGRETFVLRVAGDSMIDEQIRDGDHVIVERRDTAEDGDTVVALIDGREATVKKFYRQKDGRVRLQPANRTMTALIVDAERCLIQGIVIGLLRKY